MLQYHSSLSGKSVKQGLRTVSEFPSRIKLTVRSQEKGKSDWEKQFAEAVKKTKQALPKVDEIPVPSAPKFAKRSQRVEKVKKQESQLLDFWTQELSFKIGGAVVVGLLFVFLFIIGPP